MSQPHRHKNEGCTGILIRSRALITEETVPPIPHMGQTKRTTEHTPGGVNVHFSLIRGVPMLCGSARTSSARQGALQCSRPRQRLWGGDIGRIGKLSQAGNLSKAGILLPITSVLMTRGLSQTRICPEAHHHIRTILRSRTADRVPSWYPGPTSCCKNTPHPSLAKPTENTALRA